jgi:hypothetical protein
MRKARDEVAAGNAGLVVALVPARTSSVWWQSAVLAASLVRFLPTRIENDNGKTWPFPCAVLVFGRLPGRHGTTAARCAWCRRWYWPARADARTCSPRCRKAASRAEG